MTRFADTYAPPPETRTRDGQRRSRVPKIYGGETPGDFLKEGAPFSTTRLDEICRKFAVLVQNRSWGLLRAFLSEVEREADSPGQSQAITRETPLAALGEAEFPMRLANMMERRGILYLGQLADALEAAGYEVRESEDGGWERTSLFAEQVPGLASVGMRQILNAVGKLPQGGGE